MDAQHLYIAQVVGSYWLVSISMVYLNKVLMTSAPPLFITWCQCVTTVVVCYACGKAGEKGEAAPRFFRQFPSPEVSPRLLRATLPLSLTFLSMITLNNLCLTKVHVSFYNVARSLTIVFNVVLSWFVLGQRSTGKTMGCLGIVVMGFVVGTQVREKRGGRRPAGAQASKTITRRVCVCVCFFFRRESLSFHCPARSTACLRLCSCL